jgi:hypothetical protein
MRRPLTILLYLTIALVVVSEARTVMVALLDHARFVRALPGTEGPFFAVFVATSAVAGINAILVGARLRWAVWLNILIGLWSIFLLLLVGAPLLNALVVAVACTITVGVPLLTWMRDGTHVSAITSTSS